MKTIIANGTVITAGDTFQADVMLENGKIVQFGSNLDTAGATVSMGAKL